MPERQGSTWLYIIGAGKRSLALLALILLSLLGLVAGLSGRLARPEKAVLDSWPTPSQATPEQMWMTDRWVAKLSATTSPAATPTSYAPTTTPRPRLSLTTGPGGDVFRLAQSLVQQLSSEEFTVERLPANSPADLYLGYNPPPKFHAVPLTVTRFVPVVSFWLPITEVAYADLERIFQGEIENWTDLGSPQAQPIVPLALRMDPPAPLQPRDGTTLPNISALLFALEEAPGGIALVPREQVDVRMRALRVDGRDPLQEEETAAKDPLVRQLCLAWDPQTPSDVVKQVAAFAQGRRIAPSQPMIEIAVVGDVMSGRGVALKIRTYGEDYTRPFALVGPSLRQADLTIANLEGVLSNRITPPTDPGTFYFVASGQFVEGLLYAGVDGVSLANNHSMNFGPAGLSDTLTLLEEAGIASFGAGMDLEQARRPALFEIEGVTFAFLGFDGISHELYGAGADKAGSAPAYAEIIAQDIAAAREHADVVIPYFHWGWEYTSNPSPWQQQLAHHAVDAGADVVLGNHPHWVQGIEYYQDVIILHSLGNFVFDQMWSWRTRLGVIVRLVFRGDQLVSLRFQAIQIEDYHQPRLLPAVEAEQVYQLIQEASLNWPNQPKGAGR